MILLFIIYRKGPTMDTERSFLYRRHPEPQLAWLHRPSATDPAPSHLSGLAQDSNPRPQESCKPQTRTQSDLESGIETSTSTNACQQLGYRVSIADQHESIPFARAQQTTPTIASDSRSASAAEQCAGPSAELCYSRQKFLQSYAAQWVSRCGKSSWDRS